MEEGAAGVWTGVAGQSVQGGPGVGSGPPWWGLEALSGGSPTSCTRAALSLGSWVMTDWEQVREAGGSAGRFALREARRS